MTTYTWDFGGDSGGGFANGGSVCAVNSNLAVCVGDSWGPRVTTDGGSHWVGPGWGAGINLTIADYRYGYGSGSSNKFPGRHYIGTGPNAGSGGHLLKIDTTASITEIGSFSFGIPSPPGGNGNPRAWQKFSVDYDSVGNVEYIYFGTAANGIVRLTDEVPTTLWNVSPSNTGWTAICQADASTLFISTWAGINYTSSSGTTTYKLSAPAGKTLRTAAANTLTSTTLTNAPGTVWDIVKWDNGNIYAACGRNGVYQVSADGATWTQIWPGDGTMFTRSIAGSGTNMMTSQNGAANSSSIAGHGTAFSSNLSATFGGSATFNYVASIGHINFNIYGTTTPWWHQNDSGTMEKSSYDGAAIQYMTGSNGLSYMQYGRGGMYRTDNGGTTWQPLVRGLNGSTCSGAINTSTGGVVNFNGGDWPGFHSTNHGALVTETATSPTGDSGTALTNTFTGAISGKKFQFVAGTPVDITVGGVSVADNNFRNAVHTGSGNGGAVSWEVSNDEYIYVVNWGGLFIGTPGAGTTPGVQITGPGAQFFNIVSNNVSGATIAAGASKTLGVTFSPPAGDTTTHTATLTITDNATPTTQTVTLSGTGTGSAPVGTLSPTTQNFGTVLLGSTSASFNLNITNSGGNPSALLISNVALTGTNANEFNIFSDTGQTSLNFNQTRTVAVKFAPVTAGSKTAALTFTDNTGGVSGTAQSIPLTATANQGTGTIVISPTSPFQFPDTLINTTNSTTIQVTNTGTGPLTITSVTPGVST